MRPRKNQLAQHDATALALGYNGKVRTLEVSSITTYGVIMVAIVVRLYPWACKSPWLVLAAFLTGYFGADFVSGFVHWMADTWGSVDMPFIGNALLRPFREHHVDAQAITRHDFVETNGNNCLISIPSGLWALFTPQHEGAGLNLFWSTFLFSLILWVMFTNQFHKWSHLSEPRGAIAILQKLHLILPPGHHAVHHTAPYRRSYSITAGWVNYPLNLIRFYPLLEQLVSGVTGLIPRRDDLGEREALTVLAEDAAEGPQPHPDRLPLNL